MRTRTGTSAMIALCHQLGRQMVQVLPRWIFSPAPVAVAPAQPLALAEPATEADDSLTCVACKKPKPRDLFATVDDERSATCKSCGLVGHLRVSAETLSEPDATAWTPDDFMHIKISCVEKNELENYTILCERCLQRRDPQVIPFYSNICRPCWKPNEYEHFHRTWQEWQM